MTLNSTPEPPAEDAFSQAELAARGGDLQSALRLYATCAQQRQAELNLINSVQQGLSSRVEMPDLYNLVGDKLRDTFNAQVVMISQYDAARERVFHHYAVEKNVHLHLTEWMPVDVSRREIIETRRALMINADEIIRRVEAAGMKVIPGTEMPKTWLGVPMIVSGKARGVVSLQNLDREYAFSPSDIDLLMTLTTSLTLSLENARLFSETQRLLKETEQRNSELAVINSIQQGLAAEMNFQGIVDLVGDKLREVFRTGDMSIAWYDPKANIAHYLYRYEHGKRLEYWQHPPKADGVILTRRTVIWHTEQEGDKLAGPPIPGTDSSKSGVAIPIISNDQAVGSITLENFESDHAFGEAEVRLLTTIAGSLGAALENAHLFSETQRLLHLLEKEMEFARETQRSILPDSLPTRKGYDLGALIIPARSVSGDFYDVIELEEGKLGLVIGDVTDKGLPAALYMALTFSLVREEARRNPDPYQLIRNVNQALMTMNSSGMFVTLLYCVLDPHTGRVCSARAGHPYPVVLGREGGVEQSRPGTGQPLGLFEDIAVDRQDFEIPRGGMLVLHSDGLSEAIDPAGQYLTMEAIHRRLAVLAGQGAYDICCSLWNDVSGSSSAGLYHDDFTVMVVKRL